MPYPVEISRHYLPQDSDYLQQFSDNISLGEIQGKRPNQQDKLVAAVEKIKGFEALDEKNKALALKLTFQQMQKKHGNVNDAGSTGCVATASLDEKKSTATVTTANLGDSRAFIVILDKNDNVSDFKFLNTLHTPETEKSRIKKDGGKIDPDSNKLIIHIKEKIEKGFKYITRRLGPSRVFGDKIFFKKGISHTPDITSHTFKIKEGQRIFVGVACDGMEEGLRSKKSIINRINAGLNKLTYSFTFKNEKSKNYPKAMTHSLIRGAYQSGSEDNISVGVMEVTMTPASIAVFDAHGKKGEVISNAIGSDFYSAMEANIQLVSTPDGVKEATARLEAHQLTDKSAQDEKLAPFATQAKTMTKKELTFVINHSDPFNINFIFKMAITRGDVELVKKLIEFVEIKNINIDEMLESTTSNKEQLKKLLLSPQSSECLTLPTTSTTTSIITNLDAKKDPVKETPENDLKTSSVKSINKEEQAKLGKAKLLKPCEEYLKKNDCFFTMFFISSKWEIKEVYTVRALLSHIKNLTDLSSLECLIEKITKIKQSSLYKASGQFKTLLDNLMPMLNQLAKANSAKGDTQTVTIRPRV